MSKIMLSFDEKELIAMDKYLQVAARIILEEVDLDEETRGPVQDLFRLRIKINKALGREAKF